MYFKQWQRKLWKSGTVGGRRGEESGRGSPILELFWKYWCKFVQFGALWGQQVIKSGIENRRFSVPLLKSGTEFTVPAVWVLRPLISSHPGWTYTTVNQEQYTQHLRLPSYVDTERTDVLGTACSCCKFMNDWMRDDGSGVPRNLSWVDLLEWKFSALNHIGHKTWPYQPQCIPYRPHSARVHGVHWPDCANS